MQSWAALLEPSRTMLSSNLHLVASSSDTVLQATAIRKINNRWAALPTLGAQSCLAFCIAKAEHP
jgi:hypothetical protein